ncbi:hypothetical protein OG792_09120 [Micromonospora sp. NBC_01699]|uniref:hypothetical protein n=1 Tax=Micromonospora sp. NBC_01699 TaxID=2975984 RepID=UPI002E2F9A90|nr:hypothetical protein [Micromonospora sp. NBC_01699]
MASRTVIVLALLVVLSVATGSVVILLRRRNSGGGPDQAMRAARRAIRQSARDRRQRTHGSLRGKGQGGIESQAFSEAPTSDSGGGAY